MTLPPTLDRAEAEFPLPHDLAPNVDLLFERGIDICHETVRFGPMFASEIKKRRIQHQCYSPWRWHLDEVFVRISGETPYLWRAVDHEDEVHEAFPRNAAFARLRLSF